MVKGLSAYTTSPEKSCLAVNWPVEVLVRTSVVNFTVNMTYKESFVGSRIEQVSSRHMIYCTNNAIYIVKDKKQNFP